MLILGEKEVVGLHSVVGVQLLEALALCDNETEKEPLKVPL